MDKHGSNHNQLSIEIIARSEADTWDEAKLEWEIDNIYRDDEPDTCLCGHFPIIEICVLHNRLNGNDAIVGNVCVNKFMGLPSDLIFQGFKKIKKDESNALNRDAIEFAYQKKWINNWEHGFYLDTMRKRSPTEKQMKLRLKINRIVLSKMIKK